METMSNSRNFRVNVNLLLWFHDHRRKARIFINDEIQTIRDLEKRIEKIFKIKNFHLVTGDEYLPPSEDVRILQKDDIVWVIRDNSDTETILQNVTPTVAENTEPITHKKRLLPLVEDQIEKDLPRKKKKKEHDVQTKEDDQYPKTKKTKKKKESKEHEDTVKYQSDATTETKSGTSPEKKKKLKTLLQDTKSNLTNINTFIPTLQSHIKAYNKKVNKTNETETSSTSSDLSSDSSTLLQNKTQSELNNGNKKTYECKGTLSSYKKKVSVPTITDKYLQEKKTNIVKIEIVSRTPTNVNQPQLTEDNGAIHNKNVDKNTNMDIDEITTVASENKNEYSSSKTNSLVIDMEKDCSHTSELSHASNKSLNKSILKVDHENNNSEKHKTSMKTYDMLFDSIELSTINGCNDSVSLSKTGDSLIELNENEKNIRADEGFVNLEDSIILNHTATCEKENGSKESDSVLGKLDTCFTEENKTGPSNSSGIICDISSGTVKTVPQKITEDRPDSVMKNYESYPDCTSKIDPVTLATSENIAETESIDKKNIDAMKLVSSSVSLEHNTGVSDQLNENKNLEVNSLKPSDRLSDGSLSSYGSKSTFSRRKQLSGIGQLLGELRSNESAVTGDSMDSEQSEFVTVRKRKRIRKRKKKSKGLDTSLDDSFVVSSSYEPKPIRSKACPTLHLKFDEEGSVFKIVDTKEKEKKNGEDLETSGIENITIDSEIEQLNLTEKDIKKSPSIKNLLPKIGEIIAFKVVRITENYTAEVSSYIIGKVVEFNPETKAVQYEILSGLDKCIIPKGKLYMEEEDKSNESNRREFSWTDMIDPRLLFP